MMLLVMGGKPLSYPFTVLAAQTCYRAEFITGSESRTVFFRTDGKFSSNRPQTISITTSCPP